MNFKILTILTALFCFAKCEILDEDRGLISELRERIEENAGSYGPEIKKEAEEFLKFHPDGILNNWVLYYDRDLDTIEKKLMETIIWRKENNIRKVHTWKQPSHLKKNLPYNITGYLDDGTPIVYIPAGDWDLRRSVQSGPSSDVIKYLIYITEVISKEIYEDVEQRFTKERSGNSISIINMENLPISQVTSIRVIGVIANGFTIFEKHYPFISKSMTFINTPAIFSVGMDVIKASVNPKSLERIKFFGSQKFIWEKHLKSIIPANVYPNELKKKN